MNNKAKGARGEYRARNQLQAEGFMVIKAGGSLGLWDLAAVNATTFRLIQVKTGKAKPTAEERAKMMAAVVPNNATKEIWTFKPYARQPIIEVLK